MKFFIGGDEMHKARKLHGRRVVHGFDISIENAKGTRRYWHDPHGRESGSTLMRYDYGYIRRTEGTDGDHVDVYIGPNPESERVFIVDQMKKPDFTEFDEQKVMLGFDTKRDAKRAYLRQYDDRRFFGGMREMTIQEFRRKVLAPENRGEMIKGPMSIDDLLSFIGPGRASSNVHEMRGYASGGQKPPGSGWQPIPNGRHGGYRKREGAKWVYWYPDGAATPQRGAQEHEAAHAGHPSAAFTEEQLAAGAFDKNALHWHRPRGTTAYWTSGGVDPHSKAPVKYEGRIAVLYQIEHAIAPGQETYAVLRDVKTGQPFLARHDRIYAVEYDPKRANRPGQAKPPSTPAWDPTDNGRDSTTFDDGSIGVSGERAPRFAGSKADPEKQPGLHAIENGIYPMKAVTKLERDDNGNVRRSTRAAIAVHDHGKHQLVQEFERLVNATAKQMQKRFKLPSAYETDASGRTKDLTLMELRRAGVEGVLAAIEAYRADGPFTATAQQYVRDHVRLAAMNEAGGGLAIPQRHQRNLARYVAARARAAQVLEVDDPTPEQVMSFFDLRKKHVHANLPTDIGNQPVPMDDYHLHAEKEGPRDTERSPGKEALARMYHEFIEGSRGVAEFHEDNAALPALGIGVGYSPEQKIHARRAIARAMKELREVSVTSEGRKKITYTADVSEILSRKLGLHGNREEMTNAEIAREVPVYANGKALDPRSAAEKGIVDRLLEEGLRAVREKLDGDAKILIERAEQRVVPPVRAEPGPTFWQKLQERAKKVSQEEIAHYREHEAARLSAQASRMEERAVHMENENDRGTQMKLAAALREASRRASRMDEHEVRMKLAQRLLPETDEMRRLATRSVAIEVEHGGRAGIVDITDPSTGAVKRVRVRSLDDLTQASASSLQKADASKLSASMLGDVLRYPRTMRLLFAPDDVTGGAPTLARAVTETLTGML